MICISINYSWYFGKVSRKEAEKLLMSDEESRGTFLVRDSEHNPHGYSVSVKDWDATRGYHVKHYKVKGCEGGFYIATGQSAPTLQALVAMYTSTISIFIYFLCLKNF